MILFIFRSWLYLEMFVVSGVYRINAPISFGDLPVTKSRYPPIPFHSCTRQVLWYHLQGNQIAVALIWNWVKRMKMKRMVKEVFLPVQVNPHHFGKEHPQTVICFRDRGDGDIHHHQHLRVLRKLFIHQRRQKEGWVYRWGAVMQAIDVILLCFSVQMYFNGICNIKWRFAILFYF